VEDSNLDLDVAAKSQDRVRVVLKEARLLVLVEAKESAVFSDLVAETIRDMVPGIVHGLGDPMAGPGTAFACGVNCF
jgi:hypothetical protein